MNYATFAALPVYDTWTAALAASAIGPDAVDGVPFLINETKIAQDGRMPDSGPASQKFSNQIQKAKTLNNTINRNDTGSGTSSASVVTTSFGKNVDGSTRNLTYCTKVGGSYQSNNKKITSLHTNKEVVANTKTPAIRHKVSWFVADSNSAIRATNLDGDNLGGYRRVFGLLEDSTTTSPYRDDDAQVRK